MSTSASVSFEALGGRSNGDLDDADFLNKRSAMSSPGSVSFYLILKLLISIFMSINTYSYKNKMHR